MAEADQLDQLILRTRNLPHQVAVREVNEYFRSLSEESARALAESRPEQVGSLDGAPLQLRYLANHVILTAAHQRLQALVESGQATGAQRRRYVTLDEMLKPVSKGLDVDADGNRIHVFGPRQFLLVDPEGQGRMIEVLGDLEKARTVAVLVPGMNNDLERVRSQSDRAKEINEEAGRSTATVVWLGYHAPIGLTAARSTESSRVAAPLLCRFHAGLDVMKAPGAETTLIGNSYGAQVVGRAMLEGVRADRVLLTGSPGVDPSVHSAAQLTPPGTQLFVARARGDYVSYSEQHGPDPASFSDVFRIETDNDKVSITGHMSYFAKNSESMRNVGRIVRGELTAVTRAANTTPEQETRLLPGVSWSEPLRKLAHSEASVPISKVFDGVMALRTVSSTPSRAEALDGARACGDGGATPRRPEGRAR